MATIISLKKEAEVKTKTKLTFKKFSDSANLQGCLLDSKKNLIASIYKSFDSNMKPVLVLKYII